MQVVRELIERYLPGHSDDFVLETIPAEGGHDTYELDSRDGKVVLRGNAGSVAAALGWYIKYTMKANISWCGKRIPVFEAGALPMPEPYRRVIEQEFRVYMNYCTHSYSAAWWNWDRWEYEIDMMALNGINMPLAITGTESVWYHTLLDLGFTDAEARAFIAGPAFQAWQLMTNLEGHGGPIPMSWIEEHEALGKKILERELAFGMKPIQQGYSGFVPNLMKEKFPEGKFLVKKTWNNIGRTTEVDPLDPLFKKIGKTFMKNQQQIFGTYGYYACDPFHEGEPPVEGEQYLNDVGRVISELYAEYDENYTWVMQAWSIRHDIVVAVPREHLLILDLDCEFPVRHEGYWGYRYVVGRLHNFGARMSSIHGDMHRAAANGFNMAKESAPAAVGTGLFMEGIGQNPAFYDLSLEMLTRSDSVDPYEWIDAYIERRYDDFRARSRDFIALLGDIDRMLAVRPEWTIQKWIADARAHGTTDAERDLYEYNARIQITIWGNEQNSLLFDYAWKEWAGLIGSYHIPRWEKFFAMLDEKAKEGFDYPAYEDTLPVFENRIIWHADDFYTKLGDWEAAWVASTEPIELPEVEPDYVFEMIDRYKDKI